MTNTTDRATCTSHRTSRSGIPITSQSNGVHALISWANIGRLSPPVLDKQWRLDEGRQKLHQSGLEVRLAVGENVEVMISSA